MFLYPLLLFILTSCGNSNIVTGDKVFVAKENRFITGKLKLADPNFTGDLQVKLLKPDGIKVDVKNFQYNLQNSEFSFEISNTDLYKISEKPNILKIISMNEPIPNFTTFSDQEFYFRFQFLPKTMEKEKTQLPYFSDFLFFNYIQYYASSLEYKYSSELTAPNFIQRVVTIKDMNDKVIQDATVILVNNNFISQGLDNIPSWQTPSFMPEYLKTDENGEVLVYPIIVQDDSSNFSLIVYSNKHCTFVSNAYLVKNSQKIEIKLKECEVNNEAPHQFIAEPFNFVQSIEENVNQSNETVLYTNKNNIDFRLDSIGHFLSGIKYKVIEEHAPGTGENNTNRVFLDIELKKYLQQNFDFKFQSLINIGLPNRFKYTNDSAGDFKIIIETEEYNPNLSEEITKRQQYIFYGKKSLEIPNLDFLDNLKISGPYSEKIVSAMNDESSIKIESISCLDNFSFSLKYKNENALPLSSKCKDNIAYINTKDLLEKSKIMSTQSGEIEFLINLINKYGNSSINPIDSSNEISIYFDFSKPSLQTGGLKFGVDFGFKKDGLSSSFPSGNIKDGKREHISFSKSENFSDIYFSFLSADTCESTTKDSVLKFLEDGIDNKIYKFKIESLTEEDSEDSFVLCQIDRNIQKININNSHISYPKTPSEDAEVKLKVMDLSGNISDPFSILIPRCLDNINDNTISESIPYCWKD